VLGRSINSDRGVIERDDGLWRLLSDYIVLSPAASLGLLAPLAMTSNTEHRLLPYHINCTFLSNTFKTTTHKIWVTIENKVQPS
jgi:hypothetical protein